MVSMECCVGAVALSLLFWDVAEVIVNAAEHMDLRKENDNGNRSNAERIRSLRK